jgi:hypothetical protein
MPAWPKPLCWRWKDNINYEKVIEIDKMAQEHGVRLSHIMGHNGFITDEEFSLCKEHAMKKLGEKI